MRALFLMLCFAPLTVLAADDTLRVSLPWAPPSLSQPNGVGFITLQSDVDDALLRAESDCCKAVELHTHIKDGDVFRMRKVKEIPLPAGEQVRLRPGGYHLMLIGLKAPLGDGDTVPVRLHFRTHAPVDVALAVDRQQLLDQLKTSRHEGAATDAADDHSAHHDHH